jgi:hypothetical protein
MNIQTVADNLKRTIAGKEMLLVTYNNPSVNITEFVRDTLIQILEVNIDELKHILQDVEQCIEEEA